MLVPRRLFLGLRRRVWQLAFVPGDRAARLRAQLPLVSLGSRVKHSLPPTLPAGMELHSGVQGTGIHNHHLGEEKGSFSTCGFTEELTGRAAVANVCLSHGGPGLLRKGSGSTGACAARAVHKPVCNSHLQGDDIPAPGEGSFAQLMPVTSILCWLTQGGTGQLAASPGAWKRPRCQCWCESRAPCPPTLPVQLWSVSPTLSCPRFPTAEPSPAGPARAGTPEGRAASCSTLFTMDICSSRDSETKEPRCQRHLLSTLPWLPRGARYAAGGVIAASAGGRCVGSTPGAAQLLLPAEGQTAPVLHAQARVMPGDASA